MQYKTIVLELLEQRKELHKQLQQTRQLLPAMEALAIELRHQHRALMESMSQANPGMDPSQIPSQALELAIKDLEDHLLTGPAAHEEKTLSLDAAMAYIRSHMLHG